MIDPWMPINQRIAPASDLDRTSRVAYYMSMDTKICRICHQEKSSDVFIKRLGLVCNDCKSTHNKSNNSPRLEYIKEKTRDRKKKNAINIFEYLKLHPCVDCGNVNPPVLDFDHINGDKVSSISKLCNTSGWDRVSREISKCVVRCANCHRIRTDKQFNHYRWLLSERDSNKS
jgi:hypothetical protein